MMIPPRSYIPEIHDVHPGMADTLERLLAVLSGEAREKAVALIVPDWEGRFALDRHPRFCERLRALRGEKVLHGWTHSLGASWWNALLFGTENHSEFGWISQTEASSRLASGREMFERCLGERPAWFCAPRWHQSAGAREALQKAEFKGWMRWGGYTAADGTAISLPALNFDVGRRAPAIATARILRRGQIARVLRSGRPFRLALHPGDADFPKTWRQLSEFVRHLDEAGWSPLSLGEVMAK